VFQIKEEDRISDNRLYYGKEKEISAYIFTREKERGGPERNSWEWGK
jgi:hypothetical protein